jgi:hypothetical protein
VNTADILGDWPLLKTCVYFEDGSLRDIFIRSFSSDDWICWMNYINGRYPLRFFQGDGTAHDSGTVTAYIAIERVQEYWLDPDCGTPSLSIDIGGIDLRAQFGDEHEFENDISPRDIRSYEAHLRLMEYLKNVSRLFEKPVILTIENPSGPNETLLTIDGDIIRPGSWAAVIDDVNEL